MSHGSYFLHTDQVGLLTEVANQVACFHKYGVSLDARMNEYLDWWATDASDVRSSVTLRHVLCVGRALRAPFEVPECLESEMKGASLASTGR